MGFGPERFAVSYIVDMDKKIVNIEAINRIDGVRKIQGGDDKITQNYLSESYKILFVIYSPIVLIIFTIIRTTMLVCIIGYLYKNQNQFSVEQN